MGVFKKVADNILPNPIDVKEKKLLMEQKRRENQEQKEKEQEKQEQDQKEEQQEEQNEEQQEEKQQEEQHEEQHEKQQLEEQKVQDSPLPEASSSPPSSPPTPPRSTPLAEYYRGDRVSVVVNSTHFDTYEAAMKTKQKELRYHENKKTYRETLGVIFSKKYENKNWLYRVVCDSGSVERFVREEFISHDNRAYFEYSNKKRFAMQLVGTESIVVQATPPFLHNHEHVVTLDNPMYIPPDHYLGVYQRGFAPKFEWNKYWPDNEPVKFGMYSALGHGDRPTHLGDVVHRMQLVEECTGMSFVCQHFDTEEECQRWLANYKVKVVQQKTTQENKKENNMGGGEGDKGVEEDDGSDSQTSSYSIPLPPPALVLPIGRLGRHFRFSDSDEEDE